MPPRRVKNATSSDAAAAAAVSGRPPTKRSRYNLRSKTAGDAADVARTKVLFDLLDGTIIACIFGFFDAATATLLSCLNKTVHKYYSKRVILFSTMFLHKFHGVASGTVEGILRRFPCMRVLSLSGLVNFGDSDAASLASLSFCQSLEQLVLSGTKLGDTGLLRIAAVCTRLRLLRVSHCRGVTNDSLAPLVSNNRRLTFIDASATLVSDDGVRAIATNCPELEFLDLSWTTAGDASLLALADNLRKLNSFRLPQNATDAGLDQVSLYLTSLTSIGMIRAAFTDDALERCGQRLVKLSGIHLAYLQLVTDRGLEKFAEHSRRLTLFDIRNAGVYLTDRGVGYVIRNNPRLAHIKIRNCARVSDLTLESIGYRLLQVLQTMELHALPMITFDTLKTVVERTFSLHTLSVKDCTGVSAIQTTELAQKISLRHHLRTHFMRRRYGFLA